MPTDPTPTVAAIQARLDNPVPFDFIVHAKDDMRWLLAEHARLAAEVERLSGIVSRLPVSADGVPVTPGMKVYAIGFFSGSVRDGEAGPIHHAMFEDGSGFHAFERIAACFSTRDAALAAARAATPSTTNQQEGTADAK